MARPRTGSLRLVQPEPEPALPIGPLELDLPDDEAGGSSIEDGVRKTEKSDGSVELDFNPDASKPDGDTSGDFYANLASQIADAKLSEIASDLIEGIQRDIDSRKEWMTTRERGITLLGLKLEDPATVSGESTAEVSGTSRVHHPLLLEATVRFQATARAELLPAGGPIKIRNDSTPGPKPAKPLQMAPVPPSQPQNLGMVPPGVAPPGMPPPGMPAGPGAGPPPIPGPMPPMPPGQEGAPPPDMMGHNGGPPMEDELPISTDELASALERDMNHYLTVTAKEYIPDTDRMLFYIGFGGDGFKKVFNCPLRRRPVSESVDAEDLIVSNSATALGNCGRVTHRIKMRKSVLKRMQIIKAYRDVSLGIPAPPQPDAVQQKKAEIEGQQIRTARPQDQDYTIYESYCELVLDEFAPTHLKGEGLALPYRVTIESDSKQVLSIIRNWDEDDEQALPKQFFVQFPFIRGLGFYGIGFIHLLGNTTVALTALWRECIDAGMFANFPGFLYLRALGRQLTNQFRVPPGGGVPIDAPPGMSIKDAIMPVPYKEPGAVFTSFISKLEETAQRLAMTADINVGEGKQDAPVGTTLALIEQATKIIDSAHKRLHAAQAEEFGLLKERFKEDPEAFWRHNKRPTKPWTKELFARAIEDNDLVPVADPNNPTSMHRIAKATAVKELQKASPNLYNPKAVDERVMRIVGIDPEGLFNETPTPDKPDPRLVAIQEKAKASQMQAELGKMQAQLTMVAEQMKLSDRAQERASREKIAAQKQRLEETRLVIEQIKSSDDWNAQNAQKIQEMYNEQMNHARELEADQIKHIRELNLQKEQAGHEMALGGVAKVQELSHDHAQHTHEMTVAQQRHEMEMEHERQKHEQKMEHERKLGEAKVIAARALARVKKTNKPKKAGDSQ